MASAEETKLQHFFQWLEVPSPPSSGKVNGVELRGCKIKYCDSNKGFGIFSANDVPDGILLVVPLDLAITPMRVLQDLLLGPECRSMFDGGVVDDRFLIIVFLMVERLRRNSSWKPYLDMLPTTFGNPLWFSDEELLELKGTALYRATQLQKKSLLSLYNEKVKKLAEKLLTFYTDIESEASFDDFLWANSVFWTRAQNIPLPRSYVFPAVQEEHDNTVSKNTRDNEPAANYVLNEKLDIKKNPKIDESEGQAAGVTFPSQQGETVWVEGLIPGIDFCNHDSEALATWEVDGTGSITGIPLSMYLLSAGNNSIQSEKEISISYGNKGNEELLYLYGFVINDNTDDYLMIHYPVDAIQDVAFSEQKRQLLDAQRAELRCLLPRSLLNHGFFTPCAQGESKSKCTSSSGYSWSGQRKMPSYTNKLVFSEDFMTALRTITMNEDELYRVASLLEELVGPEGERQPSDTDVRAAIWEACGDSGALQLLVDLISMKLMDLEEGSGTEDDDAELLKKAQFVETSEDYKSSGTNDSTGCHQLSRMKLSCIIYRRGQKQLTRLFLKEAEHALQLALDEGS